MGVVVITGAVLLLWLADMTGKLIFMVALWNRADHYFHPVSFFLLLFYFLA